jgi:hypothetical protein
MANQLSGQNNTESVVVSNLSATINNALFVPPLLCFKANTFPFSMS